jgi:hypothetical protein
MKLWVKIVAALFVLGAVLGAGPVLNLSGPVRGGLAAAVCALAALAIVWGRPSR